MPRTAQGIVDILVRVKQQGKEVIEGYRKQLGGLDAGLQRLGLSQKAAGRITAALGSDFAIAAGAITGVGLAIFGMAKAITAGVQALKALTDESEQAARSQRILENAVKLNGGNLGAMTAEVERLSKALGIGDERAAPFVAAVNKLLQAAGHPEELEKFSQALLDIGAARSAPIEEVASAVDAATRGMTRGLERLIGVDVDGYLDKYAKALGGTKEQLTDAGRETAIFNLITEQGLKVQGAAAAEAETATGEYAKLVEQLNNIEEEIGRELTPVFITLLRWIRETITAAQSLWKALDPNNVADAFRRWLVDLGIVADDFRDVEGGASSAGVAIDTAGKSLINLTKATKEFKVTAAEGFDLATQAAAKYVATQVQLQAAGVQTAESTERIRAGIAILQQLYADSRATDEQRVLLLQAMAAAQDQLAASTIRGNNIIQQQATVIESAQIPAILRGTQALKENKDATDKAVDANKEFAQSLAEAAAGPLEDFFGQIIEGNLDLIGSFKAMAQAVLKSIGNIIAQMLAWQAIAALFGAFGFNLQVPSGIPGVKGKKAGGYISGPGTGTSDSISARLSNGEYVMTAAAVRRLGVQNLNALNYGARGFAEGGLVGTTEGSGGGAGMGSFVRLGIGLDEGLTLTEMQTDKGGKVVIDHIQKNKNRVRRALGI